jgi:hypothetical protein
MGTTRSREHVSEFFARWIWFWSPWFDGDSYVEKLANQPKVVGLCCGSPHRLNMELDLQSLFGLLCTAVYSLAETPQVSPPRHLGSYTRARLVSQDRRHLFVTPWFPCCTIYFVHCQLWWCCVKYRIKFDGRYYACWLRIIAAPWQSDGRNLAGNETIWRETFKQFGGKRNNLAGNIETIWRETLKQFGGKHRNSWENEYPLPFPFFSPCHRKMGHGKDCLVSFLPWLEPFL